MAELEGAAGSEGIGSEGATNALGDGSTGATDANAADSEPLYTVLVGGVERKITLDEALKGWMRTEDYTQKSQANAAEKAELAQYRALADAIEKNPQATIKALAAASGMTVSEVRQATAGADDRDPVEQRLDQLQASMNARDAREAQQREQSDKQAKTLQQIQSTLVTLHGEGHEFVDDEFCHWAAERKLVDLRQALRYFELEKAEEKRVSEMNKATAAKRQQAAAVGGGRSSAPGTVEHGSGSRRPTLKEAYLAAVKQTASANA